MSNIQSVAYNIRKLVLATVTFKIKGFFFEANAQSKIQETRSSVFSNTSPSIPFAGYTLYVREDKKYIPFESVTFN